MGGTIWVAAAIVVSPLRLATAFYRGSEDLKG
jgi:hypothetical protein